MRCTTQQNLPAIEGMETPDNVKGKPIRAPQQNLPAIEGMETRGALEPKLLL